MENLKIFCSDWRMLQIWQKWHLTKTALFLPPKISRHPSLACTFVIACGCVCISDWERSGCCVLLLHRIQNKGPQGFIPCPWVVLLQHGFRLHQNIFKQQAVIYNLYTSQQWSRNPKLIECSISLEQVKLKYLLILNLKMKEPKFRGSNLISEPLAGRSCSLTIYSFFWLCCCLCSSVCTVHELLSVSSLEHEK